MPTAAHGHGTQEFLDMVILSPLFAAHPLVTVNAALNGLATLLLLVGYVLIKQKREIAHRNVMLAAFCVSVVFLTCYLVYHIGVMQGKSTPFTAAGPVRYLYYTILISHIILAAAVPFLAAANIYLGLADLRYRHRRLARWTFPIWLYVSITGVVIYWMLYHLYPPLLPTPIM
jgi:putative membrane protein